MVDNSDIDVVAVSWGPQAKALVADVACRGTQAIDVGRLLWEIHGTRALVGDLVEKIEPNLSCFKPFEAILSHFRGRFAGIWGSRGVRRPEWVSPWALRLAI